MQTYVCLSFLKNLLHVCAATRDFHMLIEREKSIHSRSLGWYIRVKRYWATHLNSAVISTLTSIIGWHRIFPAKFWWLHLNPSMDLHHFSRRAAILLVTQTGISFGSMASGVVRRWLTDPKCRQTIANLLPINIPHIFHPHKYHTCQYCTLFHPPLCLPSAWRSTLLSAYNLIRIFRLLDSKQK